MAPYFVWLQWCHIMNVTFMNCEHTYRCIWSILDPINMKCSPLIFIAMTWFFRDLMSSCFFSMLQIFENHRYFIYITIFVEQTPGRRPWNLVRHDFFLSLTLIFMIHATILIYRHIISKNQTDNPTSNTIFKQGLYRKWRSKMKFLHKNLYVKYK